ncbi:hypothetical protein KL86PLE_130094 [uncultured Pleomorphomonas sp.]|uniref:Uncharacterized protein n=1 Tax=uncultured Pleomorphomonas sp. TaxID=442121 RepID=A0A212L980_9HYPH|nr:hypothetical protein KL86PLE_130094 [uncultured Pleomorphomonas sp.]
MNGGGGLLAHGGGIARPAAACSAFPDARRERRATDRHIPKMQTPTGGGDPVGAAIFCRRHGRRYAATANLRCGRRSIAGRSQQGRRIAATKPTLPREEEGQVGTHKSGEMVQGGGEDHHRLRERWGRRTIFPRHRPEGGGTGRVSIRVAAELGGGKFGGRA